MKYKIKEILPDDLFVLIDINVEEYINNMVKQGYKLVDIKYTMTIAYNVKTDDHTKNGAVTMALVIMVKD